MKIYLCAYGDKEGNDKGVIGLDFNQETNTLTKTMLYPLVGKANMLVESDDVFYVSEERKDGNFLKEIDRTTNQLISEIKTEYFYCYGDINDNYLYLASYSSGVDSIYDCTNKEIVKTVIHQKGDKIGGKSHYIQCYKKQVISVENNLQQIYLYDKELKIKRCVEIFEDGINIRLLSFHPQLPIAYLNTELSNELIVLNLDEFNILNRIKLTDNPTSFSGGNSISQDGNLLAISIRSYDDENTVQLFELNGQQAKLKEVIDCGKMPRDVKLVDDILFVSCTLENKVEVYQIGNEIKKITEVVVQQPITFSMK